MINSIHNCVIIPLNKIHNRAGNITIVEGNINIPFKVTRVYYLYDIPGGEERGGHAHRELFQLIISASGSFDVILDDGQNTKTFTLNRPDYGLLIVPGIWRELKNFSSGAISLVLASHKYDEDDYIRDYEIFKKESAGKDKIEAVDFSIDFLEKSKLWLRDPEIKALTFTPSFTDKEQKDWYNSLSALDDYYIKGIMINGEPAGAFGLKKITKEAAEYWGYIGEKKFWGLGYGKIILSIAIRQAKALNLKSIYLKVSDTNTRALNLYISLGFKFTQKSENIFHMTMLL